jgi:hypothetical protein
MSDHDRDAFSEIQRHGRQPLVVRADQRGRREQ